MKKKLLLLSLIITIACAFIPVFGVKSIEYRHLFGFPAQVFGYYETGHVSFELLGLVFNFFLVYGVLYVLTKVISKRK